MPSLPSLALVVEAAFDDLITVPSDGDTTVADLVGEYTQTPDGRYVFVHGPLVRTMREGRALFIEDASATLCASRSIERPSAAATNSEGRGRCRNGVTPITEDTDPPGRGRLGPAAFASDHPSSC